MEDSTQNSIEETGFFHKEVDQSDLKIQMVDLNNGLENKSINKVLRNQRPITSM